jgi:Tol biopolymer transport system component
MGLFAQLSPGGRYLAATVNETSVFVMMDDLFFSQLFFPATGQIAVFDRKKKIYGLLPGANLDTMVQTAPSWSPDGETIAFSAVPAEPVLIQKVLDKVVFNEDSKQNIEELNKKYNVKFDIYAVPFNDGEGGQSLPLEGACNNGYSNYFPRYSPDGRWIVFTQSPTGLVLQPESRLCIIPAKGGALRYLSCNMPIMNSWHSWSPNSKWIVFTCKAASPYTELYITHIDNKGESSPAVRLFRFSSKELAAMVPEFIPFSAKIPGLVSLETGQEPAKNMAIDGR